MAERYDMTQFEAAQKKRRRLSAVLICIAMPATIGLGMLLDQGKYMVISLLILLYTMLPFFRSLKSASRRPEKSSSSP